MTQSLTAEQLEELFKEEIPCSNKKCSRRASFRGMGHACDHHRPPPFYSCLQCWHKWLKSCLKDILQQGFITCADCKKCFPSIEAFNDYRPF